MSVSIDITGLPPERIDFAVSPLAELGMALHALSEPGHHPGHHGWATATAAGLKPDLADRLTEADFLWRTTFSDVFLPFAGVGGRPRVPGTTLAEDLDLLDLLDDETFVSVALEFTCSSTYASGGPSPLVSAGLRSRALDLAAARGPKPLEFTDRLLKDPGSVRVWMRRLFEDCDDAFFRDTWQRVRVQLAADARQKTDLLRRRGLAAALESVSPAVTLDEAARRIRVDKLIEGHTTATHAQDGAGLTLMPSAFGWPHLMVLHAPRWRPVIHYPVGAPELPSPATLEAVQRRMEALSHPLRMRLCRFLGRTPYTTVELADALGITAPEVSRHLTVLKKAGLITTRRRGRYVLHQLDVTVVARLGSDFLEGVLR
jgi:DNA-binding transcriptional ArsR family regulator